jgi:hypothetical protein
MRALLSNFLRDTSLSSIKLGAIENFMAKSKRRPFFSTAYDSIYKIKNVTLQVSEAIHFEVALLKFELRSLSEIVFYSSEKKYDNVVRYLIDKYGAPVIKRSNDPSHKNFYTWHEKNYRLQLLPNPNTDTGYTMKYEYNY